MFEFECLTKDSENLRIDMDECSPFLGECYPEAEGCCGPDCSPN